MKIYAERWKEYDPVIIDGVELCYEYSPTFRRFVDSPHFGKVLGWRITWAWTKNVKKYPMLKWIGPVDLGLYSVRIDDILGRTDIDSFVEEARDVPIFRKYILASAEFVLKLIANGETAWVLPPEEMSPDRRDSIVSRACGAIRKVSSLFKEVVEKGRGDGWGIVRLWVDEPDRIKALRRIFPLDVAIYCARLDSLIHNIDLAPLAEDEGFQAGARLFATEIAAFVAEVLREWW